MLRNRQRREIRPINSGFFFHPRSFSKPQTKSSQSVCECPQNVYEKLKCATCGQYAKTGEEKKIQNQQRAKSRKPLVTLQMMSTRKLQTWTSFLKCLQQIFAVIKTTWIIMGNGIELHLIRQPEQHPKQKGTYSKSIFLSWNQ